MKPDYPFEYPTPLYRSVVCDKCQRGYDSHKHETCPTCDGELIPLASTLLQTPEASARLKAVFDASPEELRKAAVEAARKGHRP